jgi:hypothetical protein
MPPVAETLGTGSEGNGKQGQDMDGKLLGQVCSLMGGRQILQDNSLQRVHHNTPIFHSAPSSKEYQAFVTTFEACEAPYYCQEHVLQVPGLRELPESEEFVAEENIHLSDGLTQKDVREDDNTVQTSNRLHSPPPTDASEPSENAVRQETLTFNPSPP